MAMKTIIEPFRIKIVEPLRVTTRAERERILRRGGLQPVQRARRGRPDRSADRQRHLGHERPAVGRNDRRGRILRRRAQLLPLRKHGAGI